MSKRILIFVVLILLWAVGLQAATIDPLLVGLMGNKSGTADVPFVFYKHLIAMETDLKGTERVGVILHLEGTCPDFTDIPELVIGSVTGKYATARLPVADLHRLVVSKDIAHIEAATISYPALDVAVPAANVDQVWNGAPAYTGDGVIVAVIDSGIDWSHDDFDNSDGTTRILNIWDLYGTGTPPTGFAYGAEYSSAQINAGTAGERDFSGHGTHVTGMAAGNGRASAGLYKGVAYEADIIFAKAFDDEQGGFPSDKTIDALNYLAAKQQHYGQPMVINMSLGGHSGAHDGTGGQEQVVDAISGQGITVCIAAGNEGESFIHDYGPAANTNLTFRMPEYTANAGTENDYAIITAWVDGEGSPSVQVSSGGSSTTLVPSGSALGFDTANGYVIIDNASAGPDPANGDKMIIIQFDDRQGTAPVAGDWSIHVEGGSGDFHAWKQVSTMVTGFPNSDQSYTVGSPGNAETAITLAAVKTRQEWPSLAGTVGYGSASTWGQAVIGDRAPFSSIGPTRDGREKPDLAAPGMAIISVRSQNITPVPNDTHLASGGNYYVAQGTSMACPFTSGVVALMLEKNSTLTPSQIQSLLRSNATNDAFTGTVWNNQWGMGKLDAAATLAALSGGTGGSGDINDDGSTSVIDIIMLVNYIVDSMGHPLDTAERTRADVYPPPNGDSVLNASDLARIVAFIMGLDQPAKSIGATVQVAVEYPVQQDDHWWVPVKISGSGLAAGQFALSLPNSDWVDIEPRVIAPENLALISNIVANQLRVVCYDLDNSLPSEFTVMLPCSGAEQASVAGMLFVDSAGDVIETRLTTTPQLCSVDVLPNPLVTESQIRFAAPTTGDFSLSVYDLRGHRVRQLASGENSLNSGVVQWQGKNDSGQNLPNGLYFVRLTNGGNVVSRKVVLAR